jgi:hypothetical protein
MSDYSDPPIPPSLPPEEYLRPRLAFLEAETLPRASEVWQEVGPGFVFVEARLRLLDSQASHAGWALYDLDRESRRAMRIIAGRGRFEPTARETPPIRAEVERAQRATPRSLLRPSPIQYGGFTLLRAEPGSTEFLLDAYGLVATVLLSNPVQFVLTLKSILDWPTRVILRHLPTNGGETTERELSDEFEFHDNELRVGAHLPPGSRLRVRYKNADGTELELDVVTPMENVTG